MAVILAFGSAAVFALGTVLQQRVVMDAPEAKEASAGILFRLIQHPVWVAGIAAYGIAFGQQAAALGDGRLVVVQPILATTIVFALPLGVWLSAQKITRRDRGFGPGSPGIAGPVAEDRKQLARAYYEAFAAGDREFYEEHLADDFTFSAPPDPLLDRNGFFERCWPGAGKGQGFEIARLVESGDEVIVTYEMTRADGGRSRNTEVLTFDGQRLTRTEVYFGWDLDGR
jgi:hypothetical protein